MSNIVSNFTVYMFNFDSVNFSLTLHTFIGKPLFCFLNIGDYKLTDIVFMIVDAVTILPFSVVYGSNKICNS